MKHEKQINELNELYQNLECFLFECEKENFLHEVRGQDQAKVRETLMIIERIIEDFKNDQEEEL